MKIFSLVEVLKAAALSRYVDSPFAHPGGLMLVAPPATLKTSVIDLLEGMPGVRVLSDLNVQTLLRMRDSLTSGAISVLAFRDLQKIYQRNGETASNIEGHLAGMVAEGFKHASFEDQRMVMRGARCLVIAALTTGLHRRKFSEWLESGFYRRFLWCHFWMRDPLILIDAVCEKTPLRIADETSIACAIPAGKISYDLVTKDETQKMRRWIAHYTDQASSPLALLQKILCVLRWRYPVSDGIDRAWDILSDFSECLRPEKGGDLEISREPLASVTGIYQQGQGGLSPMEAFAKHGFNAIFRYRETQQQGSTARKRRKAN